MLTADEYFHGRLDWYNFDWDQEPRAARRLAPAPAEGCPWTRSTPRARFIPAPVRFNGMPDTRWWAFEDGKTNFGDIKPGTTDLAKLLLIEFGLVYANDWFLLPYTVPAGSVLKIKGLAVTNTFGERFWIEAAGRGADEAWQRWTLFSLEHQGRGGRARRPHAARAADRAEDPGRRAAAKTIALMRDEMANMVWGIETAIPLPSGWTRARQRRRRRVPRPPAGAARCRGRAAAAPIEWQADIRYDIMTTVPEHWIPFVPEHVADDNRQIQLRRAAMPRFLANDPAPTFERVRPRTTLLREGLDEKQPYRIHEEEVSRAGTHVLQSFQRTRWNDGRVVHVAGRAQADRARRRAQRPRLRSHRADRDPVRRASDVRVES